MENMERPINPTEAFLALQQWVSGEVSRFYMEISMRDAYIKQLEELVNDLEESIRDRESRSEEQK